MDQLHECVETTHTQSELTPAKSMYRRLHILHRKIQITVYSKDLAILSSPLKNISLKPTIKQR